MSHIKRVWARHPLECNELNTVKCIRGSHGSDLSLSGDDGSVERADGMLAKCDARLRCLLSSCT
jgi:hypothetical protein